MSKAKGQDVIPQDKLETIKRIILEGKIPPNFVQGSLDEALKTSDLYDIIAKQLGMQIITHAQFEAVEVATKEVFYRQDPPMLQRFRAEYEFYLSLGSELASSSFNQTEVKKKLGAFCKKHNIPITLQQNIIARAQSTSFQLLYADKEDVWGNISKNVRQLLVLQEEVLAPEVRTAGLTPDLESHKTDILWPGAEVLLGLPTSKPTEEQLRAEKEVRSKEVAQTRKKIAAKSAKTANEQLFCNNMRCSLISNILSLKSCLDVWRKDKLARHLVDQVIDGVIKTLTEQAQLGMKYTQNEQEAREYIKNPAYKKEILEILYEDYKDKKTALIKCAKEGNKDCVEAILKSFAKPAGIMAAIAEVLAPLNKDIFNLLYNKLSIENRDQIVASSLDAAIAKGDLELCNFLVFRIRTEAEVKPDLVDRVYEKFPKNEVAKNLFNKLTPEQKQQFMESLVAGKKEEHILYFWSEIDTDLKFNLITKIFDEKVGVRTRDTDLAGQLFNELKDNQKQQYLGKLINDKNSDAVGYFAKKLDQKLVTLGLVNQAYEKFHAQDPAKKLFDKLSDPDKQVFMQNLVKLGGLTDFQYFNYGIVTEVMLQDAIKLDKADLVGYFADKIDKKLVTVELVKQASKFHDQSYAEKLFNKLKNDQKIDIIKGLISEKNAKLVTQFVSKIEDGTLALDLFKQAYVNFYVADPTIKLFEKLKLGDKQKFTENLAKDGKIKEFEQFVHSIATLKMVAYLFKEGYFVAACIAFDKLSGEKATSLTDEQLAVIQATKKVNDALANPQLLQVVDLRTVINYQKKYNITIKAGDNNDLISAVARALAKNDTQYQRLAQEILKDVKTDSGIKLREVAEAKNLLDLMAAIGKEDKIANLDKELRIKYIAVKIAALSIDIDKRGLESKYREISESIRALKEELQTERRPSGQLRDLRSNSLSELFKKRKVDIEKQRQSEIKAQQGKECGRILGFADQIKIKEGLNGLAEQVSLIFSNLRNEGKIKEVILTHFGTGDNILSTLDAKVTGANIELRGQLSEELAKKIVDNARKSVTLAAVDADAFIISMITGQQDKTFDITQYTDLTKKFGFTSPIQTEQKYAQYAILGDHLGTEAFLYFYDKKLYSTDEKLSVLPKINTHLLDDDERKKFFEDLMVKFASDEVFLKELRSDPAKLSKFNKEINAIKGKLPEDFELPQEIKAVLAQAQKAEKDKKAAEEAAARTQTAGTTKSAQNEGVGQGSAAPAQSLVGSIRAALSKSSSAVSATQQVDLSKITTVSDFQKELSKALKVLENAAKSKANDQPAYDDAILGVENIITKINTDYANNDIILARHVKYAAEIAKNLDNSADNKLLDIVKNLVEKFSEKNKNNNDRITHIMGTRHGADGWAKLWGDDRGDIKGGLDDALKTSEKLRTRLSSIDKKDNTIINAIKTTIKKHTPKYPSK